MPSPEPIVIFGGFLSFPRVYSTMRSELIRLTSLPVSVVPTHSHESLATISLAGCVILLDKLDRTVRTAAQTTPDGKVTLVTHSQGGVLARLYLTPESFYGRQYDGHKYVSRLITLGSPHYNQGGITRGGHISRYIQKHCPDAFFSPQVRYTSVAGKLLRGSHLTTRQARRVYKYYAELCGDGAVWGDGLIPLPSALLNHSQQIILDGVGHFSKFSSLWYGSPQVIPHWWLPAMDN